MRTTPKPLTGGTHEGETVKGVEEKGWGRDRVGSLLKRMFLVVPHRSIGGNSPRLAPALNVDLYRNAVQYGAFLIRTKHANGCSMSTTFPAEMMMMSGFVECIIKMFNKY